MQSSPSLLSLPGPLWPRVVAPDKGSIYGLNRTKPWFVLTVFFFLHLNCVFMLNWNIWNKTVLTLTVYCPVGWGCRIHRLHLCRGGTTPPPDWVSCMWQTIWWWSSSITGALGNAKHPFIAIASRFSLVRNGSTWLGPIYGLNRTNGILILNWIVCIRTFWLNWIVWNKNGFDN